MSWNAAKRALALGYRNVVWYPEGSDGWAAAGLPLQAAEPEPMPGFVELEAASSRPQSEARSGSNTNRNREARMTWQTPRIIEIACGCEINAYLPAGL
jgi:coenzyme PQQ precursor peptide PqqA